MLAKLRLDHGDLAKDGDTYQETQVVSAAEVRDDAGRRVVRQRKSLGDVLHEGEIARQSAITADRDLAATDDDLSELVEGPKSGRCRGRMQLRPDAVKELSDTAPGP